MSHVLVSEVLNHSPAELTALERLVLVVIAEAAQERDRPGCPARESYPSMAILVRRTGSAPTSVRSALQRLAERGLDVRVPLTTDSTGRPVYAFRGRATRYRLPHLRPQADEGDDGTSPLAKQGEHSSSPSSERRRRPEALEPTTPRHDGDDGPSPFRIEPEGTVPQPPVPRTTATGWAGGKMGRHRSWAAVVSAARDSGVDEVDVEAVAARAISDPETIAAPARLRGAPAYAARLAAAARADRLRDSADRTLVFTHHGSVECEHGEPGGMALLPATGQPRCPVCRRVNMKPGQTPAIDEPLAPRPHKSPVVSLTAASQMPMSRFDVCPTSGQADAQ